MLALTVTVHSLKLEVIFVSKIFVVVSLLCCFFTLLLHVNDSSFV